MNTLGTDIYTAVKIIFVKCPSMSIKQVVEKRQ